MKRLTVSVAGLAVFGFVLAIAVSGAFAQTYPNKPIHIIVPHTAGGNNDIRARIVAEKLTQSLGQPVIVENKAGGDGAVAGEMVAKAAPDGYTLLMNLLGTAVVTPCLYKNLRYDPEKGFDQVVQISITTIFLFVHPSVPAKSVKELVAFAKSNPGKLNYAAASSPYYLITERFKIATGTDIVHIPYKGSAPALTAVLSGEAHMIFDNSNLYLPHLKNGKVRVLAVCSSKRSDILPDVPTMMECGLPDMEISMWNGFAAPAGTPKEIIKKLNTEVNKILRIPEVKERLERSGDRVVGGTPEEFSDFIKAEFKRYSKVVRDAGIPRIE